MRNNLTIWLVIFLFNGIASFTHIAGKEAVMNLSPWVVGFFRFVLGVIAVWVLMKIKGKTITLEPGDQWRFFTLAVLAVPINQLSFLVGLRLTPASHPAILYATTSVWVLLFAFWMGIERLRWWKWAGVGLSIVGVLVLMGGELVSFHKETAVGDIILLVAVLSWALYTTLGKPLVERYGALETTFIVMIFGALMYFPFGLVAVFTTDISGVGMSAWFGVIYMGLITSGVAYYLWYWLLKRIRPSQVAVITCAQPPTAALFAWMIFGDKPEGNLILSGIIIMAGIFLMVAYGGPKRGVQ
ncbi:MAG: DMT family transporter [Candidatus Marinimicrobia bacterium]|nr:DMT family transporter [Candidatus Neomarinimicrobiota bacterium]